jgi:hypothetical protein
MGRLHSLRLGSRIVYGMQLIYMLPRKLKMENEKKYTLRRIIYLMVKP